LLFLFHEFLAFLKAIGIAVDVNDGAVIQNTIKDRRGDGNVKKGRVPLGERLV